MNPPDTHRQTALQQWLEQQTGRQDFSLSVASSDASFRQYWRLDLPGAPTRIVMDAPPPEEDCAPFVEVTRRLLAAGLRAPQLLAEDLEQGFLLLEDLGNTVYQQALEEQPEQADVLYRQAIDALVRMQQQADSSGLPDYDRALLLREMRLFPDWLLQQHLHLQLSASEQQVLEEAMAVLIDNALEQPQLFVHRDYHSRNLMRLDTQGPGILDYQDAVCGPITYDLVSLLRDCYLYWPPARLDAWLDYYRARAEASSLPVGEAGTFRRHFDLMGLQRHLKASGIFARLWHRDGKPGYLPDIPRTLNYLVSVAQAHADTRALGQLVENRVLPALALQAAQ